MLKTISSRASRKEPFHMSCCVALCVCASFLVCVWCTFLHVVSFLFVLWCPVALGRSQSVIGEWIWSAHQKMIRKSISAGIRDRDNCKTLRNGSIVNWCWYQLVSGWFQLGSNWCPTCASLFQTCAYTVTLFCFLLFSLSCFFFSSVI